MRTLLSITLWFGLTLAVAVLPSAAADRTDPEQINKLVEQLGSADFGEREKATKELDALGPRALDALRKAATSDDAEVSRRAGELVKKWERIAANDKILTPTRIRLVFKDTPVKDAVAEVQKKTGLTLVLHDPENKLADRKVTVDTGETTLLEAFDEFCRKAGLVEGDPRTLIQPVPNVPRPLPVPRAGGALPLNPAPAPNPTPFKNDETPKADKKPAPKEDPTPPAKPAPAPAPAPVPPAPPVPPVGAPGPVIMPAIAFKPGIRPGLMPNQIILVDGNDPKLPTCYTGAVRIRALPAGTDVPGVARAKDEIQVVLQVTPEPKLKWQQALGVRVEKALDDQDQSLAQVMAKADEAGNPNVGVIIGGGVRVMPIARPGVSFVGNNQVLIRLKKGEKDSKTLRQLKGDVSAQVLTAAETIMSVDKILKAKGESAKGDNGGSLKVLDVGKDDKGAVTLQVDLELPPDVQPTQGQVTYPNLPPAGGPVPPGGPAIGGRVPLQPVYTGGFQGLNLVDDKGQSLPLRLTASSARRNGNAFVRTFTLVSQPEKGQGDPARLLFTGSRLVTLEVAFTLKDVPVQ
jgi:hypothetical protein